MRRFSLLLLALALIAILSGCKAKKALDDAAIAADLDRRGTTELLNEAAEDKYDSPADGHLTDAQVQMYLKVREHEKKIADVAKKELQKQAEAGKASGGRLIPGAISGFKSFGAVADVLTADIRAAKDLGYNSAEYRWVKSQILAASSAKMTQKLAEASGAMMDATSQQLQKQYETTTNAEAKKMVGDMIAQYEQSKQNMNVEQNQDPAVAYNLQLLSKYENALNAVTQEWAKYTMGNETVPTTDQWEKQLDSAVAKAKEQSDQPQQGSGQ